MNFSQLYESIILRDLFEYITPGLVFLSSIGLTIEAFARRSGASSSFILNLFEKGGIFAFFIIIILAFPAGQFLTGLSAILLRDKDKQRIVDVINENEWFKKQIICVVSHYLKIPDSELPELLNDPKTAILIRGIGRDFLQTKGSPLHREHIARLSIISRLCQNMAIAMFYLLLSICISTMLLWDELQAFASNNEYIVPITSLLMLLLFFIAIWVFIKRTIDLRRRLITLTFQAWYIDFLELAEKSTKKMNKDKDKD